MPEGHSLVRAARRIRPVVGRRVTAGPLGHGVDGRNPHVHLGMHGRVRRTAACRTRIASRMLGTEAPRRLYRCPACRCTKRGLTPVGA